MANMVGRRAQIMGILILLPLLVFIAISIYIFTSNTNKIFNNSLIIIFDILVILSILFKHYLENILWFFSLLIIAYLFFFNIFFSVVLGIKRNKKYLINLLVPIISIILLINNIGDNIAINVELIKAKNKIENIKNDNHYELKDVYVDNGLYAFKFGVGIIDNWTAIIYDETGLLELGIEIIEKDEYYFNSIEFEHIKTLFGGNIIYIRKLEDNWFIVGFT